MKHECKYAMGGSLFWFIKNNNSPKFDLQYEEQQ